MALKKNNSKCPICKKKSFFFFKKNNQPTIIYPASHKTKFKKKDLILYVCYICKHIFQYPPPTNKEIKEYYTKKQSRYVSFIEDSKIGSDKEIEKINFIKKIVLNHSEKPLMLEIGGFDGWLIYKLKKLLKNSLLIEPNPAGVKIAKKAKIKYINNFFDLSLAKKIKKKYDIVVSRHVIEHIVNPVEFVKALSHVLKSNGVIIIETPNQKNIIEKQLTGKLILQHIHYFSENSLLGLFKNFKYFKKKTCKDFSLIVALKKISSTKKSIKKESLKFESKYIYRKSVTSFKNNLQNKIRSFKKLINISSNKEIWIYGASSQVSDLFSVYNFNKSQIKGIIDLDEKKTKLRIPYCNNLVIYSIKKLYDIKNEIIIIATRDHRVANKTLNKYKHVGKRYFLA